MGVRRPSLHTLEAEFAGCRREGHTLEDPHAREPRVTTDLRHAQALTANCATLCLKERPHREQRSSASGLAIPTFSMHAAHGFERKDSRINLFLSASVITSPQLECDSTPNSTRLHAILACQLPLIWCYTQLGCRLDPRIRTGTARRSRRGAGDAIKSFGPLCPGKRKPARASSARQLIRRPTDCATPCDREGL